jgi:hypothetical protein
MSAWASPQDNAATSDVSAEQLPRIVDLTLNPDGSVSNVDGSATVSGTVFCSEPALVDVSGRLAQKFGRSVVSGYFYTQVQCNGLTPFTADVISYDGRFVGGRARLTATAYSYSYDPETGAYEYVEDSDEVIIRLRNEPTGTP